MSMSTVLAIMGLGVTLLGHLCTFIWWASKITFRLAEIEKAITKRDEAEDKSAEHIWSELNRLKERVEKSEKNCIAMHHRQRSTDNPGA